MIDFSTLPNVVGIVGSRKFPNEKLYWIDKAIDKLRSSTVVVSGGALGVDTRARERTLQRSDLYYKPFHLEKWEWNVLGMGAGHARNYILVSWIKWYKGHLLIFVLDGAKGYTGGSKNVISVCRTLEVPYTIITDKGEIIWSAQPVEK